MRKCIRCGNEMKENCAVKIEGAGYGIVLSSDEINCWRQDRKARLLLSGVRRGFHLFGGCGKAEILITIIC